MLTTIVSATSYNTMPPSAIALGTEQHYPRQKSRGDIDQPVIAAFFLGGVLRRIVNP